MVEEKKRVKRKFYDEKERKLWKHIINTVAVSLGCAVIAGLVPILPLLVAKLFGYKQQGNFLMEWCGFFFGLTGADHVFEVLVEGHKEVARFIAGLSSLFFLFIYLLLFFGLTVCNAQVNVPECRNIIIAIGLLGVVTVCINRGLKEGKRYVTKGSD